MEYTAKFSHEDGSVLVEFPDCPGCQTFGDNEGHAKQMAAEALEGWLETHLVGGKVPPRPRAHRSGVAIAVRPRLSIALEVRWARDENGWTQAELAKRAKVAQQQIARLEDPDTNPTINTIETVAQALQRHLMISFEGAPSVPVGQNRQGSARISSSKAKAMVKAPTPKSKAQKSTTTPREAHLRS